MPVKNKKFDAEVGKVLHLVINSIYTNKDIFLRELISNASDACDKLRYQAIKEPQLINKEHEYKISVAVDKKAKTIAVADSGVGMNEDDLVKHLGTIANSGTQKFIEQFSGDKKSDMQLIGQFGVGFYAAFMVADKVDVISKKAGEKKVYKWSSDGKGEYSVEEIKVADHTGTKILLHVKDSEEEFLEKFKLRHIITTYSDHISFPVELIDAEEKDKSEVVNKVSALWQRPAKDITEKEYEEFYSHVSHLPGKPWLTIHNKIEGTLEYTNLLFIPDSQPFDLFHPDRKTRLKLYINRVFISEENNHLIPAYLRFMRGIVDSSDLPLNISRETLQNNHIIKKIRNSIVNKVLSSLKSKAEKDPVEYNNFLKDFGDILKEGLCGESTSEEKEKILEICRFQTSSSGGDSISLDDYINTMLPNQKEIYFLNGDKIEDMQKNPQLEGFKRRGIEVIYLANHVDNFWVNTIHKYKDKELKAITSDKIDLDAIKKLEKENKDKKEDKKDSHDNQELITLIKDVLKDKVKDVVISAKLVDSPACIAIPEGSMNLRMEKFLIDQKQLHSKAARILEINPDHAIWKKVESSLKNDKEKEANSNLVNVVYSQACLIEGDNIENPSEFAEQLNSLLAKIK
jgi:molecular chaperone HtpG